MKKNILKVVALALIAVMTCAILVACAPASDPDKAIEALEKNDYKAGKDDELIPAALELLGIQDGVDCVVLGAKGKTDLSLLDPDLVIIYFEDSSAANDAWDKIKDEKDWSEYKKSGKMIYWADNDDILKAAR